MFDLKLKLAQELPELLFVKPIYHSDNETLIDVVCRWLDTNEEVTEREWSWIVDELLQRQQKNQDFIEDFYRALGLKNQYKWFATSTWQQRAEAYFKVKEKI